MKNNVRIVVLCVVVVIAICAWAPWLTREYAERRVEARFQDSWKNVMDGCGMNCDGCGVTGSHRLAFGYEADFEYACGMKLKGAPNEKGAAFVSFAGTVSGLPAP